MLHSNYHDMAVQGGQNTNYGIEDYVIEEKTSDRLLGIAGKSHLGPVNDGSDQVHHDAG